MPKSYNLERSPESSGIESAIRAVLLQSPRNNSYSGSASVTSLSCVRLDNGDAERYGADFRTQAVRIADSALLPETGLAIAGTFVRGHRYLA